MNPRGVTLLGIELTTIYVVVWAIYGTLAGIAGVLLGMFLGVSSYSVGPLTASAFSIVVLGGLGSVSGSLIAAYVVGYLETLTAYLISPAYRAIPGAPAPGRGDVCAAARPAGQAIEHGAARAPFPAGPDQPDRRPHRRDAAALCLRLCPGAAHDRLLFRRVRDGLGPAVRLRRRSEFRSVVPDRPRRLYRRHPQQPISAADRALHRRGSAGGDDRRTRAGVAGAESARSLFRPHHACRRADAAEFRGRRGGPHRRRNRPDDSRRHLDRRQGQLLDRAWLHGGQRRDPLRAHALAGRPRPAGERPGPGAGRRARVQRHQAQARGVPGQRVLLRARRRADGRSISARRRSARSSTSLSGCR